MKIAFSVQDCSLDSKIDARFGRAEIFLIYDTESKNFSCCCNTQNLNAPQGAGIQAATNVAEAGAAVVITGHCGPKAFRVLSAAGIDIIVGIGEMTVAEALDLYISGKLTTAAAADVEGHWL